LGDFVIPQPKLLEMRKLTPSEALNRLNVVAAQSQSLQIGQLAERQRKQDSGHVVPFWMRGRVRKKMYLTVLLGGMLLKISYSYSKLLFLEAQVRPQVLRFHFSADWS